MAGGIVAKPKPPLQTSALFPDPRGVADRKAAEAARLITDNPMRAFELFLQAAEYGHPGANFEAGVFYERGIPGHLDADRFEAVKHYMLASIGGLASARYNLAFLYERGAGGLLRSQDRALELFDSAAEEGHGGAASALAERLFRGVVRDNREDPEDFGEEALHYWLLACVQGEAKAAMALSVVFGEGLCLDAPEHDLSARFAEFATLLWWQATKKKERAAQRASRRASEEKPKEAKDDDDDDDHADHDSKAKQRTEPSSPGRARSPPKDGGPAGGSEMNPIRSGSSSTPLPRPKTPDSPKKDQGPSSVSSSSSSGGGGGGGAAAGSSRPSTPPSSSRDRGGSGSSSKSPSRKGGSSGGGGGGGGVKKKPDRVLRLPRYFNKCGAAALVKERELGKRWTKGPKTVHLILERAVRSRKARSDPKNGPKRSNVTRGTKAALRGRGAEPARALLEWLTGTEEAFKIKAAKVNANAMLLAAHAGGGAKAGGGGGMGGGGGPSKPGTPVRNSFDGEQEEDEDGPVFAEKVEGLGPKFTFRNPELGQLLLKDFIGMGHLDAAANGRKRGNYRKGERLKEHDDEGSFLSLGSSFSSGNSGAGRVMNFGADGKANRGSLLRFKGRRGSGINMSFDLGERLGTLVEESGGAKKRAPRKIAPGLRGGPPLARR